MRPMIMALAAILALTGCVAARPSTPGSKTPAVTAETPAPVHYQGPGQPWLELTEAWQTDAQPLINIGRAELVADSLVITGWGSGPAEQDSVVLDAGRGSVRWQASQLPREFALGPKARSKARLSNLAGWAVERGDDGMLILPYHLGPCRDGGFECPTTELKPYREHGLVGFSLADRRQVWHTAPVRSAKPRADRPQTSGFQTYEVVGATSSAVLATLGAAGNYFTDLEWDAAERQPKTIAYDPTTGRELWRRKGFVAEEILVDDVALGLERSLRPGATGGVPARIDAVAGTRLWSMPAETSVNWSSVSRHGAIVTETASAAAGQFLVRAHGEAQPLPTVSSDGPGWIMPGRRGPLAWRVVPRSSPGGSSEGPLLHAIGQDGRLTLGATTLPHDAVSATLGWSGYVWVRLASGRVQAFDRTGRPRSPEFSGDIRLVDSDRLLVTRPDSSRLRLLELD
ncbi:hypothetical protein GCM10028864_34440 [Microlunatus parietis]